MNLKKLAVGTLMTLGLGLSVEAQAHRAWMLPSATVLSGENSWITVDGAVSNSLFYFEHHPLSLDNLEILSPTGERLQAQNQAKGKYRSVFDLELKDEGTYILQNRHQGIFGRFMLNGEAKRWRGGVADIATIPAEAEDLDLLEFDSRMQVFVTRDAPSDTTFKPTGEGMELVPVTHPNDLVTGEPVEFRLLVDGKPAKRVEVVVIREGIRYRDQVEEVKLSTDDDGLLQLTFDQPGMYWMEAETERESAVLENGKRHLSYSATLEVLPL